MCFSSNGENVLLFCTITMLLVTVYCFANRDDLSHNQTYEYVTP